MSPQPYYQDDLVTLYHGDCREITDWLAADVLVTDPPYGYSHASNREDSAWRNEAIAGDADLTARDDVLMMWAGRPALVFGSWKMRKPTGTHTVLTWDKGLAAGMGDLSIPWKPNSEEIYVLGRGFVGNRDSSIITGNVVTWTSKGRAHPNMKPDGLMAKLIAKTVGTVADPFAGSGSTLVAAKRLGRHSIGVEVDERYCETIAKRLDQGVLDFGDGAA
jgi:site-specific DNA-methyltransferase (adenine-specific)